VTSIKTKAMTDSIGSMRRDEGGSHVHTSHIIHLQKKKKVLRTVEKRGGKKKAQTSNDEKKAQTQGLALGKRGEPSEARRK